MSREDAVRAAFARQVHWCEALGSPFTAMLLRVLGETLDRSTRSGRLVLDWEGDPDALGDAVPLRLAGALHGLVRRGGAPDLARLYPPNPLPAAGILKDTALAALGDADAQICEWLAFAPQTNEVARSGLLYPGFMHISAETGLDLALHEIGSSAGLNLVPDRYAYRLGRRACGRDGSPVRLEPVWEGPDPQGPEPRIVSRRGCDLHPLDLGDPLDRDRLAAYVWPDQRDRLDRVQAAIGLAREDLPKLDAADAVDWVGTSVCGAARAGVARVLFHSIMLQYLPDAARARIAGLMEEAGARATAETPLAWLAFEQHGGEGPRLTVRLWPGGGQERVLARADPHGRKVRWEDPENQTVAAVD